MFTVRPIQILYAIIFLGLASRVSHGETIAEVWDDCGQLVTLITLLLGLGGGLYTFQNQEHIGSKKDDKQ
jgi:hypothetical protein